MLAVAPHAVRRTPQLEGIDGDVCVACGLLAGDPDAHPAVREVLLAGTG
jgi:hypothetical protein